MKIFMWTSTILLLILTLLSTPFSDWLHTEMNKERVESFAKVYSDLRLVSFHYGHSNKKSTLARNQVLARSNFDEKKFATEFNLLKEDPLLWELFENRIIADLESLEVSLLPPKRNTQGAKKKTKPKK